MKNIVFYIILIAVFLLGDRLAAWVLSRQTAQSEFRYSRLYEGRAAADILLVGNSRGLTFFQPYIEEKSGLSSYNVSYNGLPMDVTKVLIQDYLDLYPKPKVMVVDITACDRTNEELMTGFTAYMHASKRLDTLIHSKLPKVWWGAKVSGLFRYNNEIFQRAMAYRTHSDEDWLLDRTIAPRQMAIMEQDSFKLKLNPYLVQQLKEMTAYAQAKGIAVELVIGPYYPKFDDNVTDLDKLKTAAEQATGLIVKDYRQALDDPLEFGDFCHPNKKGSMNYIDLLRRDRVLP